MKSPDDIVTVLIDGHCQLCNGWVHFLLPRDRRRLLRFGSQQSAAGRQLLQGHGITSAEGGPVSIVAIAAGTVYQESTAALHVLARLDQPWRAIAGFGRVLPLWLRDPIYRFVARHRYRFFPRRDHCQIGVGGFEDRFLPDD